MASHFLLGDSSFRFRLDGHPSKKQPPRGAKRLVQVPNCDRESTYCASDHEASEFRLNCVTYSSALSTLFVQSLKEVPDERRDLVGRFVECEMPRLQDVDFCSRHSSA